MRVTNSMISRNSMTNINNNKINVDILNTQMTTQKKISRPSEDPVIAIRALRLRSNLSELNQYYERNIPDAKSWMEVTEGALENQQKILDDIYKECVTGSTDTYTPENRASILKNLESLRQQVYNEGNADCAGRHVFTGYKTNKQLTFAEDESKTKYEITEKISFEDIEEKRYYSNTVVVPNNPAEVITGVDINDMPQEHIAKRIRLSYEQTEDLSVSDLKYFDQATQSWENLENMQIGGDFVNVITDLSYDDWANDNFEVRPYQAIYFKETGELILGEDVANQLSSQKSELSVTYQKEGFSAGELRPEHYFDCKDITDPDNEIEYTKENQEIKFNISFKQSITVNTQASDVMDSSIGRDVDELATAVKASIAAHDKVEKLKQMQKEAQYSDPASQEALSQWLEAAEKEAVYADDNMQKIFSRGVGKFQQYKDTVTLARTDLGSREQRVLLTEERMANQQSTFEQLKSRNEDMELSDIIIQYTAAYNAYQASLQASSKANGQTLLNYL
ncbi:MAG: flagellar hook-associated protein 3 [Lachnospiraceae bacterium]|nr:flagellar hook-associated protein 3 [Lachnospiraceae bacterium]